MRATVLALSLLLALGTLSLVPAASAESPPCVVSDTEPCLVTLQMVVCVTEPCETFTLCVLYGTVCRRF